MKPNVWNWGQGRGRTLKPRPKLWRRCRGDAKANVTRLQRPLGLETLTYLVRKVIRLRSTRVKKLAYTVCVWPVRHRHSGCIPADNFIEAWRCNMAHVFAAGWHGLTAQGSCLLLQCGGGVATKSYTNYRLLGKFCFSSIGSLTQTYGRPGLP